MMLFTCNSCFYGTCFGFSAFQELLSSETRELPILNRKAFILVTQPSQTDWPPVFGLRISQRLLSK